MVPHDYTLNIYTFSVCDNCSEKYFEFIEMSYFHVDTGTAN